ncbi:carboxypeptidase regulatory-like domain-containing protein [Algoriphagus pacificus]|uniref:Carboxypeptidase-like regulatory domain-containing protein n=1 Tax=Algoriphagus pacificus TaxID=2811234 RepID=A0ABS3CEJ6_9BACT|nr:carboxypeptidase regulatory-like domain-containing protein [Algoriphagus pacificus]MBN7814916.1 carboxypeptidase-like regulatory domain-containing protein [Algoriphagus pacificus]
MSQKQHFLFVQFFFLTFLFLAGSQVLYAQSRNFSGRITNESSGEGLKDIHVFVPNSTFQTFSDSLGRFSIPNIPVGRWEVMVIGEGFESVEQTIVVENTTSKDYSFSLKPKQKVTPFPMKLSDKKRESLVEDFTSAFLSSSKYSEQIRLLNPETLIFSEIENSKDLSVETDGYLIFVNDKTGFLFTLYLTAPQNLASPFSRDQVVVAFLDLINEIPELIEARRSEREKIFLNSPEYSLRQMLTGEISESESKEDIKVSFGNYPGEYLLSFSKPFQIPGKGAISYEGDELAVRSEGSLVFEDNLILEGGFSSIHPLDQLPKNYNVEKALKLANIEKNAQVLQEKVFLQTDRSHYLRGETMFFKANMIYANPLLGPELSKVLHLEILDTTGYQEYHQVFPIKAGKAIGSVYLPVEFDQEKYIVKAYTSWSLNYGNETYLPIQIHDPSLKPVASMPEQLSNGVTIFSDKQNYSPGEQVNLNIMVKDGNGKPVASDLAIRVLDLDQAVPLENNKSISEAFSLNPVPNDAKLEDFKYPLENRYSLIGQIKNEDDEPIRGNITALINGLENIEKFKVDDDGTFEIPNISFENDFEIAIQASDRKALPVRNISLKIQDYQSDGDLPSFEFPKLETSKAPALTAQEIQANMEKGEILLEEFVLDEEKDDPVGPMIYGYPDNSVDPSTLPLNGSTSQFLYLLSGQVPGMSVTGNPPSIRFRNGGEPLVMIDGVPINPSSGPTIGGGSPSGRTATDIIAGINVFAIKRVEVIKRTVSALGEGGRNGIISIFMKTGLDLQKANDAIMNDFTPFYLSGYPSLRKFEDVMDEQENNSLLRGLRPTLYWNPEIITNSEELSQKVQFQSSKTGGPMWVEIKGISADGQPIEGRFVINQE